jgi:hypothetical protein
MPSKIGRYAHLTTEERKALTARAHAASPSSFDYWLGHVDPEGRLPDEDNRWLAARALEAYMRQQGRQPHLGSTAAHRRAAQAAQAG